MRTVRYTNHFRRDYRREKSGRHGRRLDAEPLETVTMLVKDEPLPRRYFDHPLVGEWSDHRCHYKTTGNRRYHQMHANRGGDT